VNSANDLYPEQDDKHQATVIAIFYKALVGSYSTVVRPIKHSCIGLEENVAWQRNSKDDGQRFKILERTETLISIS